MIAGYLLNYGRSAGLAKLPEDERLAYKRYVDNLHYQASMVESSYGIGKLKGEKIGEERGREHVAINLLEMLLLLQRKPVCLWKKWKN